MIFKDKANRSQQKGTYSTLQCLQFVDHRNRTRYLFRIKNGVQKEIYEPIIDLKQTYTDHMLSVQGMIIQAALENRAVGKRGTAPRH